MRLAGIRGVERRWMRKLRSAVLPRVSSDIVRCHDGVWRNDFAQTRATCKVTCDVHTGSWGDSLQQSGVQSCLGPSETAVERITRCFHTDSRRPDTGSSVFLLTCAASCARGLPCLFSLRAMRCASTVLTSRLLFQNGTESERDERTDRGTINIFARRTPTHPIPN